MAVGAGGRIFTTTDAGNTWIPREGGTTADLNAGDGFVTRPAWAVGNRGAILRSAVYAVGAAGTILKSVDGGLTWTPRAIYAVNARAGGSDRIGPRLPICGIVPGEKPRIGIALSAEDELAASPLARSN